MLCENYDVQKIVYLPFQGLRARDAKEAGIYESDTKIIKALEDYVCDFVAKPHVDLGRKGVVCPFMPQAIKKKLFYVGVVKYNPDLAALNLIVDHMKNSYLELCADMPEEDQDFCSIAAVFKNMAQESCSKLDDIQAERRLEFANEKLMIGPFHALQDSGGVHAPEFRPFRMALPMFAIRRMVRNDEVFFKNDTQALQQIYKHHFKSECP